MNSEARQNTLRIAIAGGGTGGHIIPALAIAEGLRHHIEKQRLYDDVDFLFFGSDYGMETKMIPEAGYELVQLPIRGLSRSLDLKGLRQNLLLPYRIVASIMTANKRLRQFQPQVTVGTGGYASAIPVRQSLRNGIPVVLQEQNSYPGMVTRVFAARAKQVFLTYEDAKKYLGQAPTQVTGNPIRMAQEQSDRKSAAKFFDLDDQRLTLFVLGGSQGARTVNQHFLKKIRIYLEKFPTIQFLWQTGKADFETCRQQVGANPRIKLVPFIKEMNLAYSLADLMICRAGAMTLTEINHFGLPALLIPLPSAAGNHQEHNARSQEAAGAARVVLEDELHEGAFLPVLTDLLETPEKLDQMRKQSAGLRQADATEKICKSIIRIASTSA